jgi:hypothetical protein
MRKLTTSEVVAQTSKAVRSGRIEARRAVEVAKTESVSQTQYSSLTISLGAELQLIFQKMGDTPATRALINYEIDQASKRARAALYPELVSGQLVTAIVHEPHGDGMADIKAMVLSTNSSGSEADLIVVPEPDNIDTLFAVLEDQDMEEKDVLEGPVYMLRNWQRHNIEIE